LSKTTCRASLFVHLGRDDGSYAEIEQIGVNPLRSIRLITCERLGPRDRVTFAIEQMLIGALENLFQHRRFMRLTGTEVNVKRVSLAVTQQMHFRRVSASTTA